MAMLQNLLNASGPHAPAFAAAAQSSNLHAATSSNVRASGRARAVAPPTSQVPWSPLLPQAVNPGAPRPAAPGPRLVLPARWTEALMRAANVVQQGAADLGTWWLVNLSLTNPDSAYTEGSFMSVAAGLFTVPEILVPLLSNPHGCTDAAALKYRHATLWPITCEAAGGPSATCCITFLSLYELKHPVAVRRGKAVEVYELAALQQFWRLYPRRRGVTPTYMPVERLCRVVLPGQ